MGLISQGVGVRTRLTWHARHSQGADEPLKHGTVAADVVDVMLLTPRFAGTR